MLTLSFTVTHVYYQMRKIITIQKEPAIKLHPALQRYPMVPWGSEYACLSEDLLPLPEKWMKTNLLL